MRHAFGAGIVSLLALVFVHGQWLIRLLNPIFIRYLRVGLPAGPNVLLTVRGRKSGVLRSTPVAMLRFGDRRFVQASFGEVAWVKNVRASGEAIVKQGRRSDEVGVIELTPQAAASVMFEALQPYRPSRLLRQVVGPAIRPPVGVMGYFGVSVDSTLDAYLREARQRPLFELTPRARDRACR